MIYGDDWYHPMKQLVVVILVDKSGSYIICDHLGQSKLYLCAQEKKEIYQM